MSNFSNKLAVHIHEPSGTPFVWVTVESLDSDPVTLRIALIDEPGEDFKWDEDFALYVGDDVKTEAQLADLVFDCYDNLRMVDVGVETHIRD